MNDQTVDEFPVDLKLNWLRLARTRGVGPRMVDRLLQRHGTVTRILARGLADLPSPPCSLSTARCEMEAIEALGGRLVIRGEGLYPAALAVIDDAPLAFTALGRVELFETPSLAVIGARNASGNGRYFAEHIAAAASHHGLTIASGLARGIDTAAHRGGLQGAGSTIAVLGCGVDIAYPPENAGLLAEIAERGVVISERPMGAPPHERQFPRRNRIIAGLSWGVLVVEAAERSGSLMTARMALEQGREVMAVPGSPADPRHRGTNGLIKQGAAMVETLEDVLELRPAPMRPTRTMPAHTPPAACSTSDQMCKPVGSSCEIQLESVIDLLGPEPLAVDELIRQCQGNVAEVQDALLTLELEGRLIRHAGNRVSLEMG